MENRYIIEQVGKKGGAYYIKDTQAVPIWDDNVCTSYGGIKRARKIVDALNAAEYITKNVNSHTSKKELMEMINTIKN